MSAAGSAFTSPGISILLEVMVAGPSVSRPRRGLCGLCARSAGRGRARLYIGRCQAGTLLIGREGRGAGGWSILPRSPGAAPIYIKPGQRGPRPPSSAPSPGSAGLAPRPHGRRRRRPDCEFARGSVTGPSPDRPFSVRRNRTLARVRLGVVAPGSGAGKPKGCQRESQDVEGDTRGPDPSLSLPGPAEHQLPCGWDRGTPSVLLPGEGARCSRQRPPRLHLSGWPEVRGGQRATEG